MYPLLLSFMLFLYTAPSAMASEPPHGVVLMYHRFGEDQYPSTSIRLEQFRAQLDYLRYEGFTIWPLRRLLDAVFRNKPVPDKTVALTVDDAYLSLYKNAYPLIKEYQIPLTVFISTDAVDRGQSGYMSWAQMREMQRLGVDFANHSASHTHLHRRQEGEDAAAWRKRVKRDILHAEQRIKTELGAQGMKLFAYPYGEFSCTLGKLVRDMGYTAFGQHSGAFGPMSRRAALPRFPMNERFADLEEFALKAASLPLPLAGQALHDPRLKGENPPVLRLGLAPGYEVLSDDIRCFLGSGAPLKTISQHPGGITVQAASALPSGRSRYNCTAPAGSGRFYWFSQPWQNGPDAADPDH
jgi:peptidoglycan/xylan/chitin deacetylase (PgdA/CDA1 family)